MYYLKASKTRDTASAYLAPTCPVFISATHSSDQAAAATQTGLLPPTTAAILNTACYTLQHTTTPCT
jgi:hypothetical protein